MRAPEHHHADLFRENGRERRADALLSLGFLCAVIGFRECHEIGTGERKGGGVCRKLPDFRPQTLDFAAFRPDFAVKICKALYKNAYS